jgi:uncharacterized YigZ family protein
VSERNPPNKQPSYKVPLRAAEAEFTEKRSRFIGQLAPVASEEEALVFLDAVRTNHREATHNVYAYRLKDEGACRHSDDGEPSGTAGMPLLEVFIKQDVYDFCCVATRYYGGVMLGAGGLVRAYARCGSVALEAAGVGTMRETALCSAVVPYALYERVKRLVNSAGAEVFVEEFGAEITMEFEIDFDALTGLQREIAEATSGSVYVHAGGTGWKASGG